MKHISGAMRRRSTILVCLSAVALGACGGGESSGPPVLRVFADSTQTRSASMEGSGLEQLTMLANVRYEVSAELVALDSNAPAYAIEQGELPKDRIEKLRTIFGIESPLEQQSQEAGGGYLAGAATDDDPSLYVSADALAYWSYSPPMSQMSMNPTCFDTSEIESLADPTPVTDSVPVVDTDPPRPGVEEEVLADPCPDRGIPLDVPTEDEAVEMFADLMSDIGVDIGSLDLEIFSDQLGTSVTGFLRIDGVRSPLSWSASYGDGGILSFAGGSLAEPRKLAEYARIGTSAALERLNDQQATLVADSAGDLASSGSAQGAEPRVVDIVSVEEELVMLVGVDGTVYLVPGYAFMAAVDEMGFEPRYTVSAIPDEFVEYEENPAADEPNSSEASPGEPGAGEPSVAEPGVVDGSMDEISNEEANTLLGMSEAEATSTAEANGWVVRIASRNGEQFALTMDYMARRVNLTIDNDVVTDVFIG